jgi:hypothetical protein
MIGKWMGSWGVSGHSNTQQTKTGLFQSSFFYYFIIFAFLIFTFYLSCDLLYYMYGGEGKLTLVVPNPR